MIYEDIRQLQELLEKYKFTQYQSEDFRQYTWKKKRSLLVDILKKTGRYNFLFSMILFVYYFFKELGIGITVIQSAVTLALSTVVLIGMITTGSYTIVKILIIKEPSKVLIEEIEDLSKTELAQSKKTYIPTAKDVKHILTFSQFKSDTAEQEIVKKVSGQVKKYLVHNIYNNKIINSSRYPKTQASKFALIGTIDRLDTYQVTVKLVEKKDFSIHYVAAGEFKSLKDLDSVCRKISKDVSDKIIQ